MRRMDLLRFVLLVMLSLALAACQTFQKPAGKSEASATVAPEAKETPTTAFDASKYKDVFVFTIEEIDNEGRSLLHISYPVTEQDAINARMEAGYAGIYR